ncbi:MAG: Trk system potassium transporter TrkA [Thermoanaerobacteraceae bacterium]|nr:Trk system potassium transporter TrkA [Thermoanaerobacteraceae bacterium]
MQIVIIGAGKVGFSLAEKLSEENHDVFLIEQNRDRLAVVEEKLDVQAIEGNGASISTLMKADVKNADLLIAVTEIDEINIVACLLAKQYGVEKTVARVRNPEYVEISGFRNTTMGIDLVINPEMVTAETIAKLIDVPEALNVEYYAGGRVQLLEISVDGSAPVIGKRLAELDFDIPYLIVAILRDQRMIIPRGDDVIKSGDILFIMAETREMIYIEHFLGQVRVPVEEVTILGGGSIGFNLARILENKNYKVKIIEKDYKKCQALSSQLQKTLVINGDGTDLSLLEEEDIANSDLLVAVTGDDKVNLLVSLLAKHLGVSKTIAQIRRSDYVPLVEKVGIDVAVSPRMLTAGAILKHIRRGDIISVTLLGGAKAEMLELVAPCSGKIVNTPLQNLKFPRGVLIGAIARGEQVIVPTGADVIRPGDLVMVFALPHAVKKVEELFAGR